MGIAGTKQLDGLGEPMDDAVVLERLAPHQDGRVGRDQPLDERRSGPPAGAEHEYGSVVRISGIRLSVRLLSEKTDRARQRCPVELAPVHGLSDRLSGGHGRGRSFQEPLQQRSHDATAGVTVSVGVDGPSHAVVFIGIVE
jgi:hypothetical protein